MQFEQAVNILSDAEFSIFWNKILKIFGQHSCIDILSYYFKSSKDEGCMQLLAIDLMNNILNSSENNVNLGVQEQKQNDNDICIMNPLLYWLTNDVGLSQYYNKMVQNGINNLDKLATANINDLSFIKHQYNKLRIINHLQRSRKIAQQQNKTIQEILISKMLYNNYSKYTKCVQNMAPIAPQPNEGGNDTDPMLLWLEDIGMQRFYEAFKNAGYNLIKLINTNKMNINHLKFLGSKSGAKYNDKVQLAKAINSLDVVNAGKYRHRFVRQPYIEPSVPVIDDMEPSAPSIDDVNVNDNNQNQMDNVNVQPSVPLIDDMKYEPGQLEGGGNKEAMLLWLEDIKMEKYFEQFKKANYDLDKLVNKKMSVNDFKFLGIGVKYSDRLSLMKAVNSLDDVFVIKYQSMQKQQVDAHRNQMEEYQDASAPPPPAFAGFNINVEGSDIYM